ncbi:ribosome small subunit-dependent GTPase A [bacterium]|nr:ribosome small subunit-dependent GTPase A [bacterium]RQV98055.1 MAG: ribosome small subunit-dependent GTPase A [bacterium]
MESVLEHLKDLGFGQWFQEKFDSEKFNGFQIARVIGVYKDRYMIQNENKDMPAEISGKLMFGADSPLDYPTVGDWVYVRYLDEDSFAVIHDIYPRKSVLKRKTPGKQIEFQLIAANIDTAFIMQSLDVDYNLRRLERYLVMIHESQIHPVVLLSKIDLISPTELKKKISDMKSFMQEIQIIAFSNVSGSGLNQIKRILKSGQTYCLLGSSGVGKTTLLNHLLDRPLFETRTVREKDGKGRHTTNVRQLIHLKNGAMVIDTPGMRELGHMDVETGLSETFNEIAELSKQCRFKDCSHIQEKDCAVLAAVQNGTLSEERYRNYIKLRKESDYYKMSYLEKRKKERRFGKLVKSVMKHHIKK